MKKHLRLNLQFSVTVNETAIPSGDNVDRRDKVWYEPQQRLLQAILSHPEYLHDYLRYTVSSHLECMDWKEWQALLGVEYAREENVLAPAIQSLDKKDRNHFKKAASKDIFAESVEELDNCFKSEIEHVELVVEDGNE